MVKLTSNFAKKISRINLFLFLYLFCSSSVLAQININSFGVDFGIIHDVDPNSEFIGNNPVLFPEAYLGFDLIEHYLNLKVSLGYWDDGRGKSKSESQYSYTPNFSYSGFVINAEMIYLTPDFNPNHPSPLRFLAGLSYQHISAKDITLYESDTIQKNNFTDNIFYFDTGLELHFFIQKYLSLFTKGLVYLQLNNDEKRNYKSPRFQISLGLNYQFGN